MATTFTRRISVNWGTTGVAASLYYTVYNGSDSAVIARSNTGVTELPAGSGNYRANVTWDNSWTSPMVYWDAGVAGVFATEDMPVANTTQVSGTATALGSLSGSQSVTVSGTGISVTDA